MNIPCFSTQERGIPLQLMTDDQLTVWATNQPHFIQAWLKAVQFTAEPNTVCLIPGQAGQIERVLVGIDDKPDLWSLAFLVKQLPTGYYHVADDELSLSSLQDFAIGWGLASYQFGRYKTFKEKKVFLYLPATIDHKFIINMVSAVWWVRNLINTPCEDMGPEQLSQQAQDLTQNYGGQFNEIVGEALIAQNFPAIYTVGRASTRPPRLIELQWGNSNHPALTLVGKGVCFDTGGLDLKSSSGMRLMKKDMGGAANALGLARLIMATQLPIFLKVLIPAVENAVSGNAYRPGDVIKTRQGLSVEIGNTDAEGRLILADTLTLAAAENPKLIIDFATLTGAARIALGTEIPALFSNNNQLANNLCQIASDINDPLWHMPLYTPYGSLIESKIADLNNSAEGGYGGAITAALFLKAFVPDHLPWAHIDMMAWNLKDRPGRPEGGEAMTLRACYRYLTDFFIEAKK